MLAAGQFVSHSHFTWLRNMDSRKVQKDHHLAMNTADLSHPKRSISGQDAYESSSAKRLKSALKKAHRPTSATAPENESNEEHHASLMPHIDKLSKNVGKLHSDGMQRRYNYEKWIEDSARMGKQIQTMRVELADMIVDALLQVKPAVDMIPTTTSQIASENDA